VLLPSSSILVERLAPSLLHPFSSTKKSKFCGGWRRYLRDDEFCHMWKPEQSLALATLVFVSSALVARVVRRRTPQIADVR
jgi:hypothetical protein